MTAEPEPPVPLLVRVAGLPAGDVALLSSGFCAQTLDDALRMEETLAAARSALAERLHAVVAGASPELRRLLLAARRDAFNGRELARHRAHPLWEELLAAAGPLLPEILETEQRLAAARAGFAPLHQRELVQERRGLARLLTHGSLRRGIALSSPSLLAHAGRLTAEHRNHRQRRLEMGLARYVTRAAFKLSPFSTLTRVGLATAGAGGVHLQGGVWRERSLVRLRRYLLDQVRDALLRHPPFRQMLAVALNDTLEEIEPGRFRLYRPGFWETDAEGNPRFTRDALVRVSLGGPLAARLRERLAAGPLRWDRLQTALEQDLGEEAGAIAGGLDQLLDVGFLRLLPPWPSNTPQLESRMAGCLRALGDGTLGPLACSLESIVALESGLPESPDPAGTLAAISRSLAALREAAAELGGTARVAVSPERRGEIFEDVFLTADGEDGGPEVLRAPAATLRQALQEALPLAGLTSLYHHRHDFLHALEAFAGERWPGRREIPLLELFEAAQPLWQSYARFVVEIRRTGAWRSGFDPFGSPEMAALGLLRDEVWDEVSQCPRPRGDELSLAPGDLLDILARVPRRYAPPVGPCLFLQPLDAAGERWMLNRLYEGTGRLTSRFTAVMDEPLRRRWTAHLAARSVIEQDGEELALLDLLCDRGDTLNVHAAQTLWTLVLPGERADLPAGGALGLRDLRVRLAAGRGPRLADASGRLFLPVHLGGSSEDFMPPLIKFLALFGPSQVSPALPVPPYHRTAGGWSRPRLWLGRILLHRRRWLLPAEPLRQAAERRQEAEAFAAVHRWRRAHGLPDRVFFREKVPHEKRDAVWKPQFLDFRSPILVGTLLSTLREAPENLLVEEMLPAPEAFPCDGEGRPWAVELVLDSLALRSAGAGAFAQEPRLHD